MSLFKDIVRKIKGTKKKIVHHEESIGIIVNETSLNTRLEGYNRLRDNILYLNTDGNTKVIQVESSIAHEGKTTLTCNLAVALGLAGKKTIVIDLDFRKPKVNRNFNISIDDGVSEYMLDTLKKEDIIKHSKYKNVDIITRGAKIYNATAVFISEKFKELINELRNEYDYVLLDCAPVLLVSDHIHVSAVADGVLFLVAYGMTTKNQVSEAMQALRKSGARVLGTAFTMYDKNKNGYYSHYGHYGRKGYYGYYSYYSHSDDDKEGSKKK